MGSFVHVFGNPTFSSESKRKEFVQNALKLIHEGGMMQIESVSLLGHELQLLRPAEPDGDQVITFVYNYFSDSSWETAGLNVDTGHFWSGKKGNEQFSDVVMAVHILQDLYSEAFSFTTSDGELDAEQSALGWINCVLGTKYTCDDRIKLWDLYESLHDEYGEDYPMAQEQLSQLASCLSAEEFAKQAGDFLSIHYILKGDKVRSDKKNAMGLPEPVGDREETMCAGSALRDLQPLILQIAEESNRADEEYDELIDILKSSKRMNREDKENDIKTDNLSYLMVIAPGKAVFKMITDAFGKDFWDSWESIKADMPEDAPLQEGVEESNLFNETVPFCGTCNYLDVNKYLYVILRNYKYGSSGSYSFSDDDRLYWWKPDGNVELSAKMQDWFEQLNTRYLDILNNSPTESSMDNDGFLRTLVRTMADASKSFGRVFLFHDLFYEFLVNAGNKKYQAMLQLFSELIEENRKEGAVINELNGIWDWGDISITYNEARLKIKRFLALLGNVALRQKVFGF